ncbi:pilus assembly protein Flp/PilA [Lachnospiraceae bacterium NK3A20]|nr:pilus assembly protein Flp/PilA [Lachnospiraceae bacterium NK3A20]
MKEFLFNEESGQGMVEYGLILALIAVVCIVAFTAIGNSTKGNLEKVDNALKGTGTATK